jgi:Na+-translocating ferredoxin:NAD+ oxidoreductase RnfC subunit
VTITGIELAPAIEKDTPVIEKAISVSGKA